MRTAAQIQALETAAQSWVGTPFCETSAVKGAGVCCHRLMLEVLVEAGWMQRIEVPNGSVGWARAQGRSLIAEWFDTEGSQWFGSLQEVAWKHVEPGDVLGFRFGHSLHHLAMALPGGRWLHVVEPQGTMILEEIPPRWCRHAERHWRLR